MNYVDFVGKSYIYNGNFNCSRLNLTSLKGTPIKVNKNFDCSYNKLKSLKYCPKIIEGNFDCSSNLLESLEGCPKYVGGYFSLQYNSIKVPIVTLKEVTIDYFNDDDKKLKNYIRSLCDVKKEIILY